MRLFIAIDLDQEDYFKQIQKQLPDVKASYPKTFHLTLKFLGETDKKYLLQSLTRRIDKGNLYLRFGKQQLYQNKLEIKEIKDMVKVKVGFSNNCSTQEKMTEILRELDLIAS